MAAGGEDGFLEGGEVIEVQRDVSGEFCVMAFEVGGYGFLEVREEVFFEGGVFQIGQEVDLGFFFCFAGQA